MESKKQKFEVKESIELLMSKRGFRLFCDALSLDQILNLVERFQAAIEGKKLQIKQAEEQALLRQDELQKVLLIVNQYNFSPEDVFTKSGKKKSNRGRIKTKAQSNHTCIE